MFSKQKLISVLDKNNTSSLVAINLLICISCHPSGALFTSYSSKPINQSDTLESIDLYKSEMEIINTNDNQIKKEQSKSLNRIDDFAISLYLIKRLPLELIQHIMQLLPLKYSEALSQGFPKSSALDPYQFHDHNYKMIKLEELLKNSKIEFDGFVALKIAVDVGHSKSLARLLQDPRVDPSAHDNYAIRSAARNGRTESVKMLVQDPRVDTSANDNYAIRTAAKKGHHEVFKILLQDPRVFKILLRDPIVPSHATRSAARLGHTELVKMLLQDPRVDPSAHDNYAIRWAAEDDKAEIVRILLQDPRVDPSADNNYAIRQAAEKGQTEIARMLLQDPRVDPSADDNYAIQKAARSEHIEIVKVLLEDPRVDPSAAKEALVWSVRSGRMQILKILLGDPRMLLSSEDIDKLFRIAKSDVIAILDAQLARQGRSR